MTSYGEKFATSTIEKGHREEIESALADALPGDISDHTEPGDVFYEIEAARFRDIGAAEGIPEEGSLPLIVDIRTGEDEYMTFSSGHSQTDGEYLATVHFEADFEVFETTNARGAREHKEKLTDTEITIEFDDEELETARDAIQPRD